MDQASTGTPSWQPDILGDGFESLTLDLGTDDEGPVTATLVRSLPEPLRFAWLRPDPRSLTDVDVLYIHGWSDYFFQYPLANFFTDRGARFYALDLRKYGRSLHDGQTPGYITDLADYDEEIAAALHVIKQSGMPKHPRSPRSGGSLSPRRLFLFGHSTGGLTLSLWLSRHPGGADALILNSPWLEFQLKAAVRTAITPLVSLQATVRPQDSSPRVDLGFYARAQQEVSVESQPFDINKKWRPEHSMVAKAGWLSAILSGHATVQAGLHIDAPTCVLLSARSSIPTRWSDDLAHSDSVLVVDDIAKAALKLGHSVTIERIDGALHDVFLSEQHARATAYARLDRWLTGIARQASEPLSTAPPSD